MPCGLERGLRRCFGLVLLMITRRTGLVTLDGDPMSRRGGVTSSIIYTLYQSFLPGFVRPGIVTLGLLQALERRLDGVMKLSQIPDILVGTSVGA